MRKVMLAASAAALAISVPAFADRGGHGGGHNDKGGQSAQAGHGGHGDQASKVRDQDSRMVRQEADHGRRGDRLNVQQARVFGKQDRNVERQASREGRHGDLRAAHNSVRVQRAENRDVVRVRGDDDNRVRVVTRNFESVFSGRGRGLVNGCPPGLDRKDNGCMPPGQVKNLLGTRLQSRFASSLVPQAYRSWYPDDDRYLYRSGDGFIYRVDRQNSLVDGIIPLFTGNSLNGGYYSLGDPWPQPYDFYNVPYQYRSLYGDTDDYYYRYGDGAIYRVNSGSGVIDSIVALLAGDLGVGSRLPMGYDVYNVPFAYRDRYYDTADNWYRYNDGYIYQVDPTTRLITAVINALV